MKQLQEREARFYGMKNQLSEKKWEVEAELRKLKLESAAEETADMERKHRLSRAQALGIALKAILW